jgi:hypothetical protein
LKFSYLNSFRLRHKKIFGVTDPELVTIRKIYVVYMLPRTATSHAQITGAVRGRIRRIVIGYSAGNYQIRDEESNRGMIIPLGITGSLMRNPVEEW